MFISICIVFIFEVRLKALIAFSVLYTIKNRLAVPGSLVSPHELKTVTVMMAVP